mmetsp:Transcript_46351/g.104175  ORF Transcript_46351/g.104175 Transcript_46351/m.104175 type:complete len:201 (+) Transcript_46351:28-630(+)
MGEEGGKADEHLGDPLGRPPLPGFSTSTDTVTMESIYRMRCDVESKYLKERETHPPVAGESVGRMNGYDVVRHTSYVKATRAPNATGPLTPSSYSRRSSAGSRPRSCSHHSLGLSGSGALRPGTGASTASSTFQASRSRSEARLRELTGAGIVFPKYALTQYSMNHMKVHERGDSMCRTSNNLKQSIVEPIVHHHMPHRR